MSKAYLFVGGPVDGDRIVTHERERYRIATRAKLGAPVETGFDNDDFREMCPQHLYVGHRIRSGGLIYIYEKIIQENEGDNQRIWNAVNVLLMEHYHPGIAFTGRAEKLYGADDLNPIVGTKIAIKELYDLLKKGFVSSFQKLTVIIRRTE